MQSTTTVVACHDESPGRARAFVCQLAGICGLDLEVLPRVDHHLPLFWAWGGGTQPGVVGLSVFFSLLMFLLNCEPEFASSRFDSGVSILAAAFVRPDGWIQGPLVTPEAQSSSTRWQDQVLYCTGPYFTAENIIARAVRHGSSSGVATVVRPCHPFGGRWREWLAASDTLVIGRFTRQSAVWMDETTMQHMQFAARLHPLQRAPVELHDTSRGRRRCGWIQCTTYSQAVHTADGESVSPSVNKSVSHPRAVPAAGPLPLSEDDRGSCPVLHCGESERSSEGVRESR